MAAAHFYKTGNSGCYLFQQCIGYLPVYNKTIYTHQDFIWPEAEGKEIIVLRMGFGWILFHPKRQRSKEAKKFFFVVDL